MNVLLFAAVMFADTVTFPMPPEKVDPSTVAVTNEFQGGWWNKPYHERYRILVDFDFDGHDDMLLSEPRLASVRAAGVGRSIIGRTDTIRQLAA